MASQKYWSVAQGLVISIGFTLGKREMDAKSDQVSQTAVSSTVGSIDGNVIIQAGNAYKQTGSNIIAMQGDIDIAAKSVLVNEAQNVDKTIQSYSLKQSGITVSLTNPVISAIQTGQQISQASQVTNDTRMQVLAGATAALAGKNLYDAVVTNPTQAGGVNLAVNLGTSKSQNNSEMITVGVASSSIAAGGNVNIKATGAGENSDIIVQGSSIKAGENLTLTADDQISLLAAKNTSDLHGKNDSSSASIGFSVGTGGLLYNGGASSGRGNSNGGDVSYTNTHIEAGNKLTMHSGGDTNLIGAVASGKQVVAEIGGNLNIQSLQDTSTYDSKHQSIGFSLSVGAGAVGGSVNYSKSTINSDFASVMEQSGIKAGDNGFQIKVDGNTDLKGAIIASTDKAMQDNRNSLVTASLTQSDIQNNANYSADSIGIGVGYSTGKENPTGKDQQGNVQAGGDKVPGTELPTTNKDGGFSATPPIALSASGSASSTTHSGISDGVITITNEQQQQQLTGQTADQVIASIDRDVSSDKDGSNALKPIFNEQEIQAGFSIVTALTKEMGTFLNNRAKEIDDKLNAARNAEALAQDLGNGLSDEQRQMLRDQAITLKYEASQVNDNWGAGGTYRQISTALMAAASGNVTGSNAQFIDNMVINYVQQQGATYIGNLVSSGALTEGSPLHAALHGILACAGSATSGQSCSSGAAGAAVSSLLTGLFSETSATETAEQREAKRNLIISLVTGIASASDVDAATATNSTTASVDNNWLASQQIVQMNKEMREAKTIAEQFKVYTKWAGTSIKQDALTSVGVGKGLAEAGWNDLTGIIEFMNDLNGGLNGIKGLITSPDARAALGESLYNSLIAKIDNMQLALEQGGDEKAVSFGEDLGSLLWHVGSAVTGVAGVAKGGAKLAKIGVNLGSSSLDTLKTVYQLAKADGKSVGEVVAIKNGKNFTSANTAVAEQIATKLNNFYRDGASPTLIQKTYAQAAVSSTHNAASSEVVLGKYIAGSIESYEAVAQARGSTYFSMSDWSKVQGQLGVDNMWNINKAFLDQQMAQNKSFVFTADPTSSSAGYFTKLEFTHLTNNGYTIVPEKGLYHAVKK